MTGNCPFTDNTDMQESFHSGIGALVFGNGRLHQPPRHRDVGVLEILPLRPVDARRGRVEDIVDLVKGLP